jgi:hypothetical protein
MDRQHGKEDYSGSGAESGYEMVERHWDRRREGKTGRDCVCFAPFAEDESALERVLEALPKGHQSNKYEVSSSLARP